MDWNRFGEIELLSLLNIVTWNFLIFSLQMEFLLIVSFAFMFIKISQRIIISSSLLPHRKIVGLIAKFRLRSKSTIREYLQFSWKSSFSSHEFAFFLSNLNIFNFKVFCGEQYLQMFTDS